MKKSGVSVSFLAVLALVQAGCWEDYNCEKGEKCERPEDPEVEGKCVESSLCNWCMSYEGEYCVWDDAKEAWADECLKDPCWEHDVCGETEMCETIWDGNGGVSAKCTADPCALCYSDFTKTCWNDKCIDDPCINRCGEWESCKYVELDDELYAECEEDPCEKCFEEPGTLCLNDECVSDPCWNNGKCGDGELCHTIFMDDTPKAKCEADPCEKCYGNGEICQWNDREKTFQCESDPCYQNGPCDENEECLHKNDGLRLVAECLTKLGCQGCAFGEICYWNKILGTDECARDPCLESTCDVCLISEDTDGRPKAECYADGECKEECDWTQGYVCVDGDCKKEPCWQNGDCADGEWCEVNSNGSEECRSDPCEQCHNEEKLCVPKSDDSDEFKCIEDGCKSQTVCKDSQTCTLDENYAPKCEVDVCSTCTDGQFCIWSDTGDVCVSDPCNALACTTTQRCVHKWVDGTVNAECEEDTCLACKYDEGEMCTHNPLKDKDACVADPCANVNGQSPCGEGEVCHHREDTSGRMNKHCELNICATCNYRNGEFCSWDMNMKQDQCVRDPCNNNGPCGVMEYCEVQFLENAELKATCHEDPCKQCDWETEICMESTTGMACVPNPCQESNVCNADELCELDYETMETTCLKDVCSSCQWEYGEMCTWDMATETDVCIMDPCYGGGPCSYDEICYFESDNNGVGDMTAKCKPDPCSKCQKGEYCDYELDKSNDNMEYVAVCKKDVCFDNGPCDWETQYCYPEDGQAVCIDDVCRSCSPEQICSHVPSTDGDEKGFDVCVSDPCYEGACEIGEICNQLFMDDGRIEKYCEKDECANCKLGELCVPAEEHHSGTTQCMYDFCWANGPCEDFQRCGHDWLDGRIEPGCYNRMDEEDGFPICLKDCAQECSEDGKVLGDELCACIATCDEEDCSEFIKMQFYDVIEQCKAGTYYAPRTDGEGGMGEYDEDNSCISMVLMSSAFEVMITDLPLECMASDTPPCHCVDKMMGFILPKCPDDPIIYDLISDFEQATNCKINLGGVQMAEGMCLDRMHQSRKFQAFLEKDLSGCAEAEDAISDCACLGPYIGYALDECPDDSQLNLYLYMADEAGCNYNVPEKESLMGDCAHCAFGEKCFPSKDIFSEVMECHRDVCFTNWVCPVTQRCNDNQRWGQPYDHTALPECGEGNAAVPVCIFDCAQGCGALSGAELCECANKCDLGGCSDEDKAAISSAMDTCKENNVAAAIEYGEVSVQVNLKLPPLNNAQAAVIKSEYCRQWQTEFASYTVECFISGKLADEIAKELTGTEVFAAPSAAEVEKEAPKPCSAILEKNKQHCEFQTDKKSCEHKELCTWTEPEKSVSSKSNTPSVSMFVPGLKDGSGDGSVDGASSGSDGSGDGSVDGASSGSDCQAACSSKIGVTRCQPSDGSCWDIQYNRCAESECRCCTDVGCEEYHCTSEFEKSKDCSAGNAEDFVCESIAGCVWIPEYDNAPGHLGSCKEKSKDCSAGNAEDFVCESIAGCVWIPEYDNAPGHLGSCKESGSVQYSTGGDKCWEDYQCKTGQACKRPEDPEVPGECQDTGGRRLLQDNSEGVEYTLGVNVKVPMNDNMDEALAQISESTKLKTESITELFVNSPIVASTLKAANNGQDYTIDMDEVKVTVEEVNPSKLKEVLDAAADENKPTTATTVDIFDAGAIASPMLALFVAAISAALGC